MNHSLEYSSSLNGASFLLFELKKAAELQEQGFTENEIRLKVMNDNYFQFENKGRINRTLPSIMRRLKVLDETLRHSLLHGSLEDAKVVNLYSIMKTDRLFYEFMSEVIGDKFSSNNPSIEKRDLNLFFATKAESSTVVAGWSVINAQKLKRAMMQVLFESGLLKTRQGTELNPLWVEPSLKSHLIAIGDKEYLRAIGESI
ncbi:DUF1819 family protein [Exiguobacterium sp. SH3S1]|uniref:DUF1819 family protein n=1 Tax=Exiguobacterium sp. SH3S1 TaxID=2510955 RepID=UPI00103EF434|nr:DUF1819 family protein [Exiguobacterium sp. SH3S1]TCI61819.1 DUF1819 family protein [Exiguobacterium sp. SH3S1]